MGRFLILSHPRTGSSYFSSLLNSHPKFHLAGELLNTNLSINEDPVSHVRKKLAAILEPYVGIKIQPLQLIERNIRLDTLAKELDITAIIVVWRKDLIESLASLFIALETGEWYSDSDNKELRRIEVPVEKIMEYEEEWRELWVKMAEQWPTGVGYITVCYEDLVTDRNLEINRVLKYLGCEVPDIPLSAQCLRQNPSKLEDKITNWSEIPEEVRKLMVDVPEILRKVEPKV